MPYTFGGGKHCVVVGCHNNQKKIHEWKKTICADHRLPHQDCPCLLPYSLHVIPKDENIRLRWARAINRKDFQLKDHERVCSIHFLDGRPTKRNPDPALHLGYEKEIKPGRRPIVKHAIPLSTQINVNNIQDAKCIASDYESPEVSFCRSEQEENCCQSVNVQTDPVIVHSPGEHCIIYKPKFDVGTQTEAVTDEHSYVYKSKSQKQNVSTQASATELSVYSIYTNDDATFYTGLDLNTFNAFIETMSVFGDNLCYNLPVPDQILLTLVRLRLGIPFKDLSRRFGISCQLGNKIFHSWIDIISKHLKDGIVWLPRETLKRTMPTSFKTTYPKTTCIVDCTEVYIQRPFSLKARAQTYSNYKSHNTLKFLVCIAPNGYIMFLSKCYGGRASDKYITKSSGLMNYLIPGDEVMADRGFTIGEELFAMRVRLNMPSFLCGRSQLTEKQTTESRRIASVRIHVERAIRRLKTFRVLNTALSVRSLKKMDKIVKLCGALCNLRGSLIKGD